MERGHRGLEQSTESTEILKHPELIFDGDFKEAQRQNNLLILKMMQKGEMYREGNSAIFHSGFVA